MPEDRIKDLIGNSIFKDHLKDFEIKKADDMVRTNSEKENSHRKMVKIQSDISAVISGLKCFLQEFASDFTNNLSESFFNIDAQPFMPKPMGSKNLPASQDQQNPHLALGLTKKISSEAKPITSQEALLEKKRQIS